MAQAAPAYQERLTEIAGTVFGELSDDQVLQLLAERKQLSDLQQKYEAAQEKQARLSAVLAEKAGIEQELTRLNTLISPDRPDDELIRLIEERKGIEGKLAEAEGILAGLEGDGAVDEPDSRASKKTASSTKERKERPLKKTKEAVSEAPAVPESSELSETPEAPAVIETPATPETSEAIGSPHMPEEAVPAPSVSVTPEPTFHDAVDEEYGSQRIQNPVTLEPGSEFRQALDRIVNDPDALGMILDGLPPAAKSDKAFMLGVAAVDPAYAMHYADKATLKRDEDFNLRVLATRGKRLSGSVLSEMLPEARTEAVVMAAIKQDYKNVRYALPQMARYDEMLDVAKRAALEKVRELKDGVDITLLVPKILQKDRAFMAEVSALVPKTE